MTTTELDLNTRYRVTGHGGVAFELLGYERVWVPTMVLMTDGDGNEYEVPDDSGEGNWEYTEGSVRVRMVGDDRVFTEDIDDLTPLGDDDYCPECGQIGCTAYPR